MNTIYTIGHSVLSISDFIKKLKDNEIKLLVDIRTKPYSRYNPQFNKNSLAQSLKENGITYSWRGANLGGLGENVYYPETIDELIINSEATRLAIMCSEADYKKCHRYTKITPDLEAKGVKVIHILPSAIKCRSSRNRKRMSSKRIYKIRRASLFKEFPCICLF